MKYALDGSSYLLFILSLDKLSIKNAQDKIYNHIILEEFGKM